MAATTLSRREPDGARPNASQTPECRENAEQFPDPLKNLRVSGNCGGLRSVVAVDGVCCDAGSPTHVRSVEAREACKRATEFPDALKISRARRSASRTTSP